MEGEFSEWRPWGERLSVERCPGVYALAIFAKPPHPRFSICKEIVYFGMTNAGSGLRGRLAKFNATIQSQKRVHGGALRFIFKHTDYEGIAKELYLATWNFECDAERRAPSDLRMMGLVAKAEYDCMALYMERFSELPEFNRRESEKLSRLE